MLCLRHLDPGSRCRPLFPVLALAIVAAGCGPRAVRRYEVAGHVTHRGKPVERGSISFDPLAADSASGAPRGIGGGFAPIQGGRYDTARAGRGHAGGPHRVTVVGLSAAATEVGGEAADFVTVPPLFPPYQLTVELPRGTGELDIDVPAQEAGK